MISVDSAKTAAGSPESTESELPAVMAEASNSRRVRCCSAIARIPLRGNAVGAGADRSGVGSSPSARPNDSRSTRQSILRMAEIVAHVQELSPVSASLTLKLVSRLWLSVADGIRQTGSAAGETSRQ